MPIFESVFGGQKKRYNIPADKVEEFKGKRPDAIEITNKPEPIETIGFGVRRAGEVGKLGAEPMGQEKAVAATIPQWPEKPGERTRRGIADYESALKRTNELLKNPNLTPEQRQDILYQFKIAYGTLNHEDNPRITQDARAYLEQEGAGDVASQFKSLGNAFSLDRGWDISGRLKDIGAGLGLTQDPGTSIREHKKVKNYLGKTAAGQRDVRAEQEYLAHLDRLEKELEEKIRSFEKEKIAGRRPKSDYAEMVQASVGAIPFGAHSEEDKAAIPVSDSYEKDAAILETAKRELKKVRQMRERAFDAENKSRLDQMLGEIYRRGGDTISDAVSLGSSRTLAEKEKNLALKDGENNIAREASELAMETDRMLAHKITVGQAVAGGAMESVPYMAEFAATKGIAKMLKPATAARVAELASKGGWKAAAKLGYHNMNIAATMIPFQPSTYARAYEMANEEAVANGAPAGGALDYVGRAMAEQFITNASEMAGDVFESILPNKAASGVGKASRWKKARKIAANATGVHGIPSEFVEEKAEEIGQAATGVGDTTWADMVDPRRNIITLGTVAFSQLPVQTITAMGYTAGKANNAITISNIRKGYNKNVSNMLDVFGDESKEAMETVESFVSSYGNSQEAVMAFDHAILESDEYTDAEKSAMLNYAMAYAPMVGVDKEARERAGGYVAKAASAIEQSVNKDMDAVVTIRMDKNAAVLVGGKIVQKEDGSIDKDNSDKTLYYRDENGRVHPIGIDAVDEVVESVPRAEALQQASNAVSENVVKDTANAQAVERAVGEEVAFVVDGTSAVGVGVVQAMDDAGNYVVAMPDGSVSTVEPRQLVDEEVARMENGATILYADADGAKKKGVVADGFNYQGEGLIVLEDGTKVPFESILGVLENENQDAMGEAVVTPSERESAEVSPVEEEGMSATQEEVDVYADFPKRKNGEIDSDKLTDEQSLIYAEREHGEEFAVESAQAAIDALGKKRNEVSDKMNAEGSVAKRADMQSQIKIIDKRIGVYQEYLKNREKVQDLEPSEETVDDVKKEDVQKNIPENDLSLPKENTNISRDEVSKSVSQRHDGSLPERDRGMEEESDSFRGGFEASIRNAQTDKGVISEQEIAKAARAFAKKKGRWVPLANLTELGAPFPSGMENDVYYNDREGSVYKVNNLSLHRNNILSILERIDLHNQLFPNTEYSLFGFAGFENGTVYPILKQDFVPNADFATPEEIDGYMHSMGFENSEREAEYSNGKYVVSDLRPRNVLKSLSGNFYVIDAGVELNSGELPEKQEVLSQSEDVNPLFSELEEEVNRLSELFHTPVRVHYSPETIQNATARKAAEDGLAKGWYVDGEVHIYLPNATGVEDIQETFFHEVVAHKGVKDMLGDKHSELMDALFDLIPESEQNRLLDLYGEKHIAADEYLAELAERGGFESEESRGIISKIIDAIREFLSRYHIQISAPTAEDIANSLLKESAARLTEKRKEEDAPKFNGNILSYARDLHKRNQLREAARDVEKSPSKAQQEAGNYKKGHVNVQGFDISIENPKGSTRSGVDESGKKWSITMQNDYGYFKRSEGKDGDPIDVFIGNNPESGKIFVVDQVNPETGVFDESKVMLGFNNEEDARKAYLSNYEDGWQGLGSITETDANYFKEWLYDGKKQRKAFSEYKEVVMKNKQHDRFREIVESENEKEHGWFESVMSDQQLPEERTKNNIKGVPEEFVGDDKNRPVLTGVYHSNGMISASDGLVLISEEKKYPKKDEGLIKSENGIIDGKYPSVEKVIPNMDVYSEFDAGSLVSFVERVETALKSEWSKKDRYGKRIDHRTYKVKRSNTYVVLRINGRDFVIRFDQLDKMAKAAKRLGINKIGGDVGRIHITGGNNHLVASSIDPLVFLKEFPGETVFAYDLTGEAKFRLVGGNSGYVGYSMSKRAAASRSEGRYPKTDFKKEYGVSEKTLQALVDADVVSNSEWHHTSKYGNKTTFYSWNGRYYHDVYLENKDDVLKLVEDGKDDELFDLFDKGNEAKTEEWRNSLSNRVLEAKREIMSKYHEYAKEVRQKLADVNYTASDGSIVIPDGKIDHLSMDVEKDGVRLTKRNGKRERDNARQEYFDYVNSRIMPESEWSEQNKDFVNSVLSKHRVSESDIKSDAADNAGAVDVRFRMSDEESRIKERAIVDDTFMKAPNGQPTNLNERQWFQVRTKAFKNWFGDWEKSARIEKLRKAKPVEITGKEVKPSDDLKQYKKNASEYGKTLQGLYVNKDTGKEIQLQRGRKNGGINEVLQHDYKNAEHLQSIAAIPAIIENSVYIDTQDNTDLFKNPGVREYQYYVCGLKIGSEDYTVRATIAVDNKGDRYYDHKLTKVEKGKLLDLIENQAALNNGFGATPDTKSTTTFSGYKDTNLVSLLQNDSSKVVDENGEPMVVYHGTNNDKTIRIWDDKTKTYDTRHEPFTVFKRVNEGEKNRGHFFNSNADNAGGYGYNTYDVFLSLKHPLVIDAHGDNYSGVKHRGEEKDTYEWAEYAESKGYDGVVFLNISDGVGYGDLQNTTNDYVSFNSSQIKSATDNTGAFDEKNNDIRFRLTDVPIIDTEDLKNGIRRENRFHRTMDKFYEAYQDTYLPVKRLYERIAAQGVKVEDWENFYAQATHIPGKNQAEIEVYTSKYMNPMIEQVKALQDKGLSFREIENYVMLKHGMERNEYMRDRESSKYLKKHPRATATKLDELKSKDYAGVRDIAREVGGLDDIPEIGTAEGIAEEFVRDIEAKCGNESIGSFWDAVTAATRFSLTKSYHSGILSKDGYDELISRYKYYVPLRGHDAITAEDKWDYISESGSPTFSSPIKRAKGRSSRAESPFAFIFQTAQSAIMAGNKNRLKSTLLNLAESGKAGTLFNISRAWYEKAGTDEQGNDAWQLAIPKYDDDPVVYAENIASFEERMKEESKKGNAVQGRRKLDLGGMFIKPSQAAEHEIHIRRNGEDLVMYVNADPALARSVNGTNRVMSDSRFMHGARWSTRQIAAMSTSLNPLFTASNFMRDLQYSVMKLGAEKGGAFTAGYSVRLGRILFKDKVLVRMLNGQLDLSKKYDQYAYEFLMNGGKTGYVSALNLETAARRIEKELKRLGVRELSALNPAKEAYLASKCARAVGDFFVMSNEITENSIRLAAYITSRESGESIINSVNTAKEVTVNFNRRGSGAMGADIVNSLFMFTNVAFQALDNFAKIAIRHKWKIAAVMATYMLSGLLQSWWIDEWGSDDSKEAYWGTSDWDRQNNLCVPVGRGLLKIPHPQELRALRGLGVGIYQSIKGTKSPEDTVLDLLSAVADVVPMGSTFVPSEASVSGVATAVSPTVLQPVTQWVTNMNFKGSPVRNAYAPEYAPGHLQARTNRKGEPRADKWIYDLCEFINVSVGRGDGAKKGWIDLNPDAVQHFAGGYFGGLFSTASGTVNTIYMAKSYDDARGLRIRDTPLRRFYAETADMNNVDSGTMSKYYDLSKKADQAHYMFGRYKKQLQDKSLTPEDYREKIEELNYPYWKSIRDELSAIRRLERRLKDVAEDEQVKLDMKSAEMKRRLVKRFEKDMEVKHEE